MWKCVGWVQEGNTHDGETCGEREGTNDEMSTVGNREAHVLEQANSRRRLPNAFAAGHQEKPFTCMQSMHTCMGGCMGMKMQQHPLQGSFTHQRCP